LGTINHTPPLEAHHIIPLELMDSPIVQSAALDGFHINDIINGIGLESPSLHNGSHPKYTDYVIQLIEKWEGRNSGYTSQQANEYLQQTLIKTVKAEIYNAQRLGKRLEEHFSTLL
jgi:hypothetical protein